MADINTMQGGHARVFIQEGGPTPRSGFEYFGAMQIGDADEPQGTSTPVSVPSTRQRNKWDIVDDVPSTPELGTLPFTQRMDRFLRDALWDLKERNCRFHLQAVIGKCTNPADFTQWDAKILYAFARLTSFSHGTLNPLDGGDNAVINETGEFEFRRMIPIRQMRFGEVGAAAVVSEIVDGLFYDIAQCGDCGPASDGCEKAYFLSAPLAEPETGSQILVTRDGGSTFDDVDITSLGTDAGTRLAVVGNHLVVISEDGESHHFAPLDAVNDGVDEFAAVTGGYVTGKGPRAIYSKSALQTWLAGAGGYIYQMSDPASAVTVVSDGSLAAQDLNDIHGSGNTVVAVGASNVVLVSTNDGDSFTLVTGPAVGVALNAVWVMDDHTWLVGAADGGLFFTVDGGRSWSQIALGSAVTAIHDIRFVDDPNAANTIGYLAASTASGARVYRSTDSGHSWQYRGSAIDRLPTAHRINGVAVCGFNRVAAFGLREDQEDDGILAIAN